jgi:hypothetical protein
MSALGQKQTFALQQAMSALPPIATAKADIIPADVLPVGQGGLSMNCVAAVDVRSNSSLVSSPRSPDVIDGDSGDLGKLDHLFLIEEKPMKHPPEFRVG